MQKTNQKRSLFPLFLYICPEPVAIKDQAMANGTLIHQWDFHGHWTQEWTFERYSGYYYTIKSTVSGTPYYMSTDGSTVKLKSNANGITDDMLWYLSYSDYGNMKIAPKARHSQNYVMAVAWDGTNQEQNGLSFIEQLYSDDAYDTDEWIIGKIPKITMIHYYDEAMVAKFGETLLPDLQTMQNFLAEYYREFFDVRIDSQYVAYTAVSDLYAGVYDSADIRSDLFEQFGEGSHTVKRIVWSGATMLEEDHVPNAQFETNSIVIPENMTDTSRLYDPDNDHEGRDNLDCLFHEFGHLLTLPDHYCKDSNIPQGGDCGNDHCDIHVVRYEKDGNIVVRHCVMASMGPDIAAMDDEARFELFCSDCRTQLVGYAERICVGG